MILSGTPSPEQSQLITTILTYSDQHTLESAIISESSS